MHYANPGRYAYLDAFEAALRTAIAERGPIGLVVCWIRSWEPDSLRLVAGMVPDGTPLYHVLGTTGTPSTELAGVDYRVVRLGRRRDRWLTNEEISAGVLEAMARGSADFLVGEA